MHRPKKHAQALYEGITIRTSRTESATMYRVSAFLRSRENAFDAKCDGRYDGTAFHVLCRKALGMCKYNTVDHTLAALFEKQKRECHFTSIVARVAVTK